MRMDMWIDMCKDVWIGTLVDMWMDMSIEVFPSIQSCTPYIHSYALRPPIQQCRHACIGVLSHTGSLVATTASPLVSTPAQSPQIPTTVSQP